MNEIIAGSSYILSTDDALYCIQVGKNGTIASDASQVKQIWTERVVTNSIPLSLHRS